MAEVGVGYRLTGLTLQRLVSPLVTTPLAFTSPRTTPICGPTTLPLLPTCVHDTGQSDGDILPGAHVCEVDRILVWIGPDRMAAYAAGSAGRVMSANPRAGDTR